MIKKEKGIALVSLIITMAVMTIVASTVVYISLDRFEINNLQKMYTDIELLQDKVSHYYLKHNALPVLRDNTNTPIQYTYSALNFTKNSADNGIYYILDLEAMEGISLNYGEEGFEAPNTSEDVYIINEESHTIYYVKGIARKEVNYYTLKSNNNSTEDNVPPTKPQINVVSGTKKVDEDGNVYYTSDVEIEIIPGKDNWSEVKKTTYSINGGTEIDIATLKNNIYTIKSKGTHEITLKSYDSSGNYSETIETIIKKLVTLVDKDGKDAEGKVLSKTANTDVYDVYGNKIVVPAGFKIRVDDSTNNADTITEGIVIEDGSGNQFVWVPVGKIYTDKDRTESLAKTITLGRYENFEATNGVYTPVQTAENYENEIKIDMYCIEHTKLNHPSTYRNSIARDIGAFITSATTNRGYYLGRFEAGNSNGALVCKYGQTVYNNTTQPDASNLSRSMYADGYSSGTFSSDLINSYAWDTAIIFIQTFGIKSNSSAYATTVGKATTYGPSTTGTKILEATGSVDEQLNIYDMAGNCREWSTESFKISDGRCVYRGAYYSSSDSYTKNRWFDNEIRASEIESFRPLLYLSFPEITLNKESIEVEIEEGSTVTETLTATLKNITGTLTWTSSDTSVAEVVGNGNTATVTLKAAGTAIITVSCGEYSKTCTVKVNVVEDELAGTWVFNDTIMLQEGGTTYDVDFYCDNSNWSGIGFTSDNIVLGKESQMLYYSAYGESLAYYYVIRDGTVFSNEWDFDSYKTIVITTKLNQMENGEEFLTWLKANAIKQ